MNKNSEQDINFDPTREVGLEEIKSYWEDAAKLSNSSDILKPTARDPFLQQAIENIIEKYINRSMNLLDVGAGDGTSTVKFSKKVKSVVGVEYVEGLLNQAINASKEIRNIEWKLGDIMNLSALFKEEKFDCVTLIRVLINLGSWDNQKKALRNVSEVIKPGGLLLMSEGWSEGWDGLNLIRKRAGLDVIQLVKYNTLIKKTKLESFLSEDFELIGYESLGFYIFMSRVFQAAYLNPESPSHLHPINKLAMELGLKNIGSCEFLDLDYAGIYIFRKKAAPDFE